MSPASSLSDNAVAPSRTANLDMAPEHAPVAVQPLLIRVDSRERQSPVPALLAAFPDVALAFAALPSAD